MSTRSFLSLVAQLNEAQAEVVRSMGFASFLKVDVKQILGKFSKWLVEIFDLYAIEPKNRYYNKSILKHVKDVSQITFLDWCQFVVDKLITSVRHYKESTVANGVHFDGPLFFLMEAVADLQSAHVEFQNLQLKQKVNNNLCAPLFSPILPLNKADGEAEIPGDTFASDASIIVEKE
ncbi:hypothetical protein Cgig2_023943 [Carnegiea gigantea]|uniref:Uncharacterized protein n=1 Tax=Carnegiea gigantea TaxID=171969 RepID=A0A9Q1GJZ7_9CARY|nr:hypothetical protein Cgig2_023943 [Carnegiea gigantea]